MGDEAYYLDEYLFDEVFHDELNDCFLSKEELEEMLTPPTEAWKDVPPTEFRTKITIDSSKSTQWEEAKNGIYFVLQQLKILVREEHESCIDDNDMPFDDESPLKKEDVIKLIIGPDSAVGKILREHLSMSEEVYLKFIQTLSIQAAYKVSTSQLFDPSSLLSHAAPMSKEDYTKIWKELSTKKRVARSQLFVGAGRRGKCVWEYLEEAVNNLCRRISVSNRTGNISVALDDDKIWANLTGLNKSDTFGIKYTTHVQPNRKGIVAHTAVSTGANMPLGIAIEKKKDSTMECFKRLLKFIFETNGSIDLRNVLVASDRGYMVPKAVFDFLIANGGNVVGTVKRSLECWPFTFDQKMEESGNRSKIETRGPPTLFVKTVSNSLKKVYATAFQNGTDRVSTAISYIHKNHHWEGIALNQAELKMYEVDKKSLRNLCFQRIESELLGNELESESEQIEFILNNEINPLTIRQGMK